MCYKTYEHKKVTSTYNLDEALQYHYYVELSPSSRILGLIQVKAVRQAREKLQYITGGNATVLINEVGTKLQEHYETILRLLKHIQIDYSVMSKEIEDMSSHFKEREAITDRQLNAALGALDLMQIGGNSTESLDHLAPSADQALSSPYMAPHLARKQFVPILEAQFLGRFQVCVCSKRIDHWSSAKAKAVLKYLLTQRGRPVSRDILMEAIWPECKPTLANYRLKAAVRALRQTLAVASGSDDNYPWILFQDGKYCINSTIELWSDVEQFERHWRAGLYLEREGKTEEAIIQHEIAEAFYKGDYLEDDLYEDWTSLRREALKDIYLTLANRLADYAMQKEDHDTCVDYCQKILVKDPCHEEAYRHLMCCHSRLGQRNRAVTWFQICNKTIKRELDLSPTPITVAMYNKVLKDEYI